METEIPNQSQIKKGVLEIAILLILKKEMYVSEIVNQTKKADFIILEGTIYPILNRLNKSGFLSYRWEESTGGPPRKYYKITPLGEKYLKESLDIWKNLVQSMENLENLKF